MTLAVRCYRMAHHYASTSFGHHHGPLVGAQSGWNLEDSLRTENNELLRKVHWLGAECGVSSPTVELCRSSVSGRSETTQSVR